MRNEVPFLCSLFGPEVRVTFGWACRRREWEEERVDTETLAGFVEQSIVAGQFEPGASDLHMKDGSVSVTLCHEQDIHVETNVSEILFRCASRWIANGFRVHRRRLDAGKGWEEVWDPDVVRSS